MDGPRVSPAEWDEEIAQMPTPELLELMRRLLEEMELRAMEVESWRADNDTGR